MARFSATDAAFEGFRLTRRYPQAILFWALAAIVLNLGMMVILVQVSGPALEQIGALSQAGAAADPAASLPALGSLMLGYLAVTPIFLLFLALFAAAAYRATTQPEAKAFGFLRLGADELRLMATALIVGVIGLVALFVLTFVISLLVALLTGGSPALMVLSILLLYVAMALGGMALYVKFSFAGPMTFLTKRIVVFGSWRATSGHFWPLFGCYALAVVLGVVVTLLGVCIGAGATAATGSDVMKIFVPDMSSMQTYFTPGMMAYLVVNSIFVGLTSMIYQGPAMAAYQAIHGGVRDVSKTFD